MILFDIMKKATEINNKLDALKLQIEALSEKVDAREVADKYREYKTPDGLFRRKK